MPLTAERLAQALLDGGMFPEDGKPFTGDLAEACQKAMDRVKAEDYAKGTLVHDELRRAAAMLLVPPLPANATDWAENAIWAAYVGPEGMTLSQADMGASLTARIIKVRELLYDFLKANEPG